jgi:branched-subunit amino acid transport protein AzlD
MVDPRHVAAIVVVSGAITWALRALPFAVLAPMRRSIVVRYLGVHMPLGVMVILAIYTLRTVPSSDVRHAWAAVAALAATIGLHLWRRHALLSIVGGTLVNALVLTWAA